VGQRHVALTLANALRTDRVSHAYLFAGPRGVGKTSMARILAKALNCEKGPAAEPCNACPACRAITEGHCLDVLEIDGASNRGIDDVRQLREGVKLRPASTRAKVYIIDEVHMLTADAFNALLKTLEEPPRHVYFVLATTEPLRVPPTILSRCQRHDFGRLTIDELAGNLKKIVDAETISINEDALRLIARKGEGVSATPSPCWIRSRRPAPVPLGRVRSRRSWASPAPGSTSSFRTRSSRPTGSARS